MSNAKSDGPHSTPPTFQLHGPDLKKQTPSGVWCNSTRRREPPHLQAESYYVNLRGGFTVVSQSKIQKKTYLGLPKFCLAILRHGTYGHHHGSRVMVGIHEGRLRSTTSSIFGRNSIFRTCTRACLGNQVRVIHVRVHVLGIRNKSVMYEYLLYMCDMSQGT